MVTEELAETRGQVIADRSTVERILHNALEHFSTHGYTGASVREITQSSEVTKPTLYYYFKNKEELYHRLAEVCFNEALNILKIAASSPGSPFERSLHMIKAYTQFVSDRFVVARFLHLMETSPQRDAPETGFGDFTRQVFEQFRGVLKEGATTHQLAAQDIPGMAYATMSVFHLHIGALLSRTSTSTDLSQVEQALKIIFSERQLKNALP